jgi:hypothetical protein
MRIIVTLVATNASSNVKPLKDFLVPIDHFILHHSMLQLAALLLPVIQQC